jgi:hypothetical protein
MKKMTIIKKNHSTIYNGEILRLDQKKKTTTTTTTTSI